MLRLVLMAMFVLLFHGPSHAESDRPTLIGSFSSLKWTMDEDPHLVDGYSVRLYRSGRLLFGRMAAANGSSEPFQGNLYDIKFDPSTGRLQFKSKMSGGWESRQGVAPQGRQGRDLFEFSGRISRSRLTGTMVLRDGYAPEKARESKKVVMKRDDDTSAPESFKEWIRHHPPENSW